ncbi:hypothetical protein DBV15_01015 [Temnothorax longispinosus]|uniref:Uncharacterized protein n=1 Tax=Temnothorax longispinosus TaxID=300112 RepID=A0A4S2JBZ6_9HYME|nr:hypothetical protein DBV15_01015 [Temnothorax longispinosus]
MEHPSYVYLCLIIEPSLALTFGPDRTWSRCRAPLRGHLFATYPEETLVQGTTNCVHQDKYGDSVDVAGVFSRVLARGSAWALQWTKGRQICGRVVLLQWRTAEDQFHTTASRIDYMETTFLSFQFLNSRRLVGNATFRCRNMPKKRETVPDQRRTADVVNEKATTAERRKREREKERRLRPQRTMCAGRRCWRWERTERRQVLLLGPCCYPVTVHRAEFATRRRVARGREIFMTSDGDGRGGLIIGGMKEDVERESRGRESCCAFCAGRSARPWFAGRVIDEIS